MKTITKTINHIQDPGHGWFSVSQKDILELGIADKISPYSYMNHTRAFLEEDCDATLFLDSAEKAGWKITIKDSLTNGQSQVRSKAGYFSKFVKNPLKMGSNIMLHNNTSAVIVGIEKGSFIIHQKDGRCFRLPKSNPYNYISDIIK